MVSGVSEDVLWHSLSGLLFTSAELSLWKVLRAEWGGGRKGSGV